MTRATRAILEVVEAHLDDFPEEWSVTQFELTNFKRGIAIWIANGAYGLHVEIRGAKVNLPFGWKRRMRRAADKWLARTAINKFKEPTERLTAA